MKVSGGEHGRSHNIFRTEIGYTGARERGRGPAGHLVVWIYKHAGLQVSKALKMNGISVLMGEFKGGTPPSVVELPFQQY